MLAGDSVTGVVGGLLVASTDVNFERALPLTKQGPQIGVQRDEGVSELYWMLLTGAPYSTVYHNCCNNPVRLCRALLRLRRQ